MNDVVRVTGKVGATPTLAFVRKGRGVTNITGEKLAEDQVNLAVAGLLADAGLRTPFYVFVADAATAGYTAYIEDRARQPSRRSRRWPARSTRRCASSISNTIPNAAAAGSSRLRLVALADGTERAYRRHCVGKGQREAQFKVLTLQNADEFDFDVTPHLISERPDETSGR